MGGVNYRTSGMLKFDKILQSNCHSSYNLGSVGFCSVTLNRYMLKISDDSE